ncbi:hypothetical protein P3T43_001589 [Paraburkholderia sp. GAS41]
MHLREYDVRRNSGCYDSQQLPLPLCRDRWMLSWISFWRLSTLLSVKWRSPVLTVLNLLPSMATGACENRFSSQHGITKRRHTLQMPMPLSQRKSETALHGRPVHQGHVCRGQIAIDDAIASPCPQVTQQPQPGVGYYRTIPFPQPTRPLPRQSRPAMPPCYQKRLPQPRVDTGLQFQAAI